MLAKILTETRYSLLSFFRNKSGMFWTFGFPILLMVILGFIWGSQAGSHELYFADHDGSPASTAFLSAINSTGAVSLKDSVGLDLQQMLKDGDIPAYLDIPGGFGSGIGGAEPGGSTGTTVSVYYDRSQQTSMSIISVIRQVADGFNIRLAGAPEAIMVEPVDVAVQTISHIEFLLPGIIGMSIMQTAVMATVSINSRNRARGIFRKLATTPISRVEWSASKIISQSIITLLSVSLSIVAAMLLFGVRPAIGVTTVLLFIAGTLTFVGIGLIMAVLVKSEESATSAASIVTFPLMFISGSFFPVDHMPWFFKIIADVSPLTYLNNGLRDTMITGNDAAALVCLGIVAIAGIVFFCAGAAAMKWKED